MAKQLSTPQTETLLQISAERFKKHPERHPNLLWDTVALKLQENPTKLWSLNEMEATGGEPDVVILDANQKEITFIDCATESPAGRRSYCFDHAALTARKANKPADNAVDVAHKMGVNILTEEQYRALQELGKFDLKTSSWIATPEAIRKLGGALFCDRRYNTVFVYHNGAESYYAARGFRALLTI